MRFVLVGFRPWLAFGVVCPIVVIFLVCWFLLLLSRPVVFVCLLALLSTSGAV